MENKYCRAEIQTFSSLDFELKKTLNESNFTEGYEPRCELAARVEVIINTFNYAQKLIEKKCDIDEIYDKYFVLREKINTYIFILANLIDELIGDLNLENTNEDFLSYLNDHPHITEQLLQTKQKYFRNCEANLQDLIDRIKCGDDSIKRAISNTINETKEPYIKILNKLEKYKDNLYYADDTCYAKRIIYDELFESTNKSKNIELSDYIICGDVCMADKYLSHRIGYTTEDQGVSIAAMLCALKCRGYKFIDNFSKFHAFLLQNKYNVTCTRQAIATPYSKIEARWNDKFKAQVNNELRIFDTMDF